MQLRQYLKFHGMKIQHFANLVDYHASSITQIVNGYRKPGRKLVRRIEKITAGLVLEEDLLKAYEDRKNNLISLSENSEL
jgi:hypothetical protein